MLTYRVKFHVPIRDYVDVTAESKIEAEREAFKIWRTANDPRIMHTGVIDNTSEGHIPMNDENEAEYRKIRRGGAGAYADVSVLNGD